MTFTPIGQTAQTQAAKSQPEAGGRHGETGAVTSPRNSSEIAAWLETKRPADMDKAAVSRASSHGVGLRVKFSGRYPTGPNGENLPSYTVATGCEIDGKPENVQAALADLRNFMTPAPMRQIEEWIARLSVITAKRKDDAFSEELRITEYASRLSQYPADVVHAVLMEYSYTFFPSWGELRGWCEALTSPRRQMIAALERGPEPPAPVRRAATAEEKARIQSLVDEMFPSKSAEERKAAVEEVTKGDCMTGDNMDGFKGMGGTA